MRIARHTMCSHVGMSPSSRRLAGLLCAATTLFPLFACSAVDEDGSPAIASRYEADSSPFDEKVWDYELQLRDDPDHLGCEFQFSVNGYPGLYAGQHFSGDYVYGSGGLLKGEMRSTKPWPEKYGVVTLDVTQRCQDGNEDRPNTIGYRGISTMDLSTLVELTAKPGSHAGLSELNAPNPLYGAAGKSIKFTYRGIEKAPPVKKDVNCAGMAPATTDRFFFKVLADTYSETDDYTLTIDSGRYQAHDPGRDWFTYCRPKGLGPADKVVVQIDLLSRRLLRDHRSDPKPPTTITAGEATVEFEHTYKGDYMARSWVTVVQ